MTDPNAAEPTEVFLVNVPGRAPEQYATEAEAVSRASELRPDGVFGAEVVVLCVERTEHFETHQRVWPTVGPAYAGHR